MLGILGSGGFWRVRGFVTTRGQGVRCSDLSSLCDGSFGPGLTRGAQLRGDVVKSAAQPWSVLGWCTRDTFGWWLQGWVRVQWQSAMAELQCVRVRCAMIALAGDRDRFRGTCRHSFLRHVISSRSAAHSHFFPRTNDPLLR